MLGDRWGDEVSPTGFEIQHLQTADAISPGAADAAMQNRVPGESYLDALARVAQTYMVADSQRRLLGIQLERARLGLPPLNSAQYGMGASVNVGVAPDTQKLLMFAALGLGVVYLLPKLLRGR